MRLTTCMVLPQPFAIFNPPYRTALCLRAICTHRLAFAEMASLLQLEVVRPHGEIRQVSVYASMQATAKQIGQPFVLLTTAQHEVMRPEHSMGVIPQRFRDNCPTSRSCMPHQQRSQQSCKMAALSLVEMRNMGVTAQMFMSTWCVGESFEHLPTTVCCEQNNFAQACSLQDIHCVLRLRHLSHTCLGFKFLSRSRFVFVSCPRCISSRLPGFGSSLIYFAALLAPCFWSF